VAGQDPLASHSSSWYYANRVKDAPLTKDQAKAQLNLCLDDGFVIYTRHFKDELASDGLTMEDIYAVCRSGVVLMASEKDIKTGDWKYRIEGYSADRESLALIFALKPERRAVFITVFKRSHD
jgi:ribulose bisphosphate carboxylase small subunit